jgi:hypothetical protein
MLCWDRHVPLQSGVSHGHKPCYSGARETCCSGSSVHARPCVCLSSSTPCVICRVPRRCYQDPVLAVAAVAPVFSDLGALLTECTHEDGGQRPGAVEARDRVRAAVFAITLRTYRSRRPMCSG